MTKKKDGYRKKQEVTTEFSVSSVGEILLTENDRVTYLYKKDRQNRIKEVINVSYELNIQNKWITIVRFDSTHGYLHRHIRISLTDSTEMISITGVKKKGDHPQWLTWAINALKRQYAMHKEAFLKRSERQ